MEQHPVPQNVTTFQFRLVGDMTIKQFGYLAAGAILAYISYKLPLPFFFTWPLAFLFGLGGVGFAFVPIEERPMDIWVMSFIKNIYNPTLYVWSHDDAPKQASQTQSTQAAIAKPKSDVLAQIFTPPTATPGSKPFNWLSIIFSPKHASAPAMPPVSAPAIPTPQVAGHHLDISTPPKMAEITPTIPRAPAIAPAPIVEKKEHDDSHARILELQKQLTEALVERDRMRSEIAALLQTQKPTSANAPRVSSVANSIPTPTKSGPTVKIITPDSALKAGLPRLTTYPNIVTGITRDSDNNLLPGVLVTVRDRDGMPIRALKTNRLGQFAASTPIANGTYLVEIEDPRGRYTFDRVQVTLNGSVVPALEIIAKSHKEVAREKLAKEIFGNT